VSTFPRGSAPSSLCLTFHPSVPFFSPTPPIMTPTPRRISKFVRYPPVFTNKFFPRIPLPNPLPYLHSSLFLDDCVNEGLTHRDTFRCDICILPVSLTASFPPFSLLSIYGRTREPIYLLFYGSWELAGGWILYSFHFLPPLSLQSLSTFFRLSVFQTPLEALGGNRSAAWA